MKRWINARARIALRGLTAAKELLEKANYDNYTILDLENYSEIVAYIATNPQTQSVIIENLEREKKDEGF